MFLSIVDIGYLAPAAFAINIKGLAVVCSGMQGVSGPSWQQ
ncbi:MAG: hypothetical protein PHU14_11540 [Methylovulum sp.]|nr:hypothetical protein [Methylovulum sp.]